MKYLKLEIFSFIFGFALSVFVTSIFTKTPISAASSTENFQVPDPPLTPVVKKQKKPRPVTAADTGPTDWHDDPALDDEYIGSCGKRHCDCSDTFESCESDIDCCNGYDVCIKNKCERYEDY